MFISIIRQYNSRTSQRSTSVYQCDRYHIHPVADTRSEFTITMERDGWPVAHSATYDTEAHGTEIYVMNDHGRTIDTLFRSDS